MLSSALNLRQSLSPATGMRGDHQGSGLRPLSPISARSPGTSRNATRANNFTTTGANSVRSSGALGADSSMGRAPFTTFSTRRTLNPADDNGDHDDRHDNGDHGDRHDNGDHGDRHDSQEPVPEQDADNSNDGTMAVLLKSLLDSIKSGGSGNSSSSREVYDGKLPAASAFNPSTMDYKEWLRDTLEQLGQLRYGIYRRQLTGNLPTPPAHNRNKFNDWVFRDEQMLTWLQSMFVDTIYYGQIRAINPAGHQNFIDVKDGHVIDPALLAHGRAGQCLELIHTKHGVLSDVDISNLEDAIAEQRSAGMALSTYTENARDLLRKTSNTNGRVLPAFVLARYVQGFAGDRRFTHAMVEVTKEMTQAKAGGCPLDFRAVSDLFVFWNNTLNPGLTKKPLYVNGKLTENKSHGEQRTGHDDIAKARSATTEDALQKVMAMLSAAKVNEGLAKQHGGGGGGSRDGKTGGGARDSATCTNPDCERPLHHATGDCFAYGGAREAAFLQDTPKWMGDKIMTERLTKIIDLIKSKGPSPFTPADWEVKYVLPRSAPAKARSANGRRVQPSSTPASSSTASLTDDLRSAVADGSIDVAALLDVLEATAVGSAPPTSGAKAQLAGIYDTTTGQRVTDASALWSVTAHSDCAHDTCSALSGRVEPSNGAITEVGSLNWTLQSTALGVGHTYVPSLSTDLDSLDQHAVRRAVCAKGGKLDSAADFTMFGKGHESAFGSDFKYFPPGRFKVCGAIDQSGETAFLIGMGTAAVAVDEQTTGVPQPVVLQNSVLTTGVTELLLGTWHITHANLNEDSATGYTCDVDNGIIAHAKSGLQFKGYREQYGNRPVGRVWCFDLYLLGAGIPANADTLGEDTSLHTITEPVAARIAAMRCAFNCLPAPLAQPSLNHHPLTCAVFAPSDVNDDGGGNAAYIPNNAAAYIQNDQVHRTSEYNQQSTVDSSSSHEDAAKGYATFHGLGMPDAWEQVSTDLLESSSAGVQGWAHYWHQHSDLSARDHGHSDSVVGCYDHRDCHTCASHGVTPAAGLHADVPAISATAQALLGKVVCMTGNEDTKLIAHFDTFHTEIERLCGAVRHGLLTGLLITGTFSGNAKELMCVHCAIEKRVRNPTRAPLVADSESDALRIRKLKQELVALKPKRSDRRQKLFTEIYTDLKILSHKQYGGGKAISGFIDRESGEIWVTLLPDKSAWVQEAARVLNQCRNKLAELRLQHQSVYLEPPKLITDCDRALVNAAFQTIIDSTGCSLHLAPPRTPELNQYIERAWHTLHGMVLAALSDSGLPRGFMGKLYERAAFVLRRMPRRTNLHGVSPYTRVNNGLVPSAKRMKRIGCLAICWLSKQQRGSDGPRAQIAWNLGACENGTWEVWLDKRLPRIVTVSVYHVTFVTAIVYSERHRYNIPSYYNASVPRHLVLRPDPADPIDPKYAPFVLAVTPDTPEPFETYTDGPSPVSPRPAAAGGSDHADGLAPALNRADDDSCAATANAEYTDSLDSGAVGAAVPVSHTGPREKSNDTHPSPVASLLPMPTWLRGHADADYGTPTISASELSTAEPDVLRPFGLSTATPEGPRRSTRTTKAPAEHNVVWKMGGGYSLAAIPEENDGDDDRADHDAGAGDTDSDASRLSSLSSDTDSDGDGADAATAALVARVRRLRRHVRYGHRDTPAVAKRPRTLWMTSRTGSPTASTATAGANTATTTTADQHPVADQQPATTTLAEQAQFNRDIRTMHHTAYSNDEHQRVAEERGFRKVGKFADDAWADTTTTCSALSVAVSKEMHDVLIMYGVPRFVHEIRRFPPSVRDRWEAAMVAEFHNLEVVHDAVTVYDANTTDRPDDERIWDSTWAFKSGGADDRYHAPFEGAKWARIKARGVIVRGIERADANIWKIHSSTGQMASLRIFLAFAATLGLDVEFWDVQGAFLNFKRQKSVWMKVFPFLRDLPQYRNKILKVTGNLYGSLDGARICERGIAAELVNHQGFTRFVEADHSCFIKFERVADGNGGTTGIVIAVWNFVDNFMVMATPGYDLLATQRAKICERLPLDLEANFTTSTGTPDITVEAMGLTFIRSHTRRTIEISGAKYLRKFAKRFFNVESGDINVPSSPQIPGQVLSPDACPTTDEQRAAVKTKYPVNAYEMLGCLMFIVNGCRPDIAQTVSQIMSFANNMSMDAHAALNQVAKFAASTPDTALAFYASDRPWYNLRAFASADAAYPGISPNMKDAALSCFVAPRGRIAGNINFAHGAVIWYTGALKHGHDSTTGVEVASLNRMCREIRWFLKFVSYWVDAEHDTVTVCHITDKAPVLIQQDNHAAIAFTHNPVSMAAMKGSLIRMCCVRDMLEQNMIYPCATPSAEMVSDLNTKAVSVKDRQRLTPQLMGQEPWTSFANQDKELKPGVCKQCVGADLTFTFEAGRWQALCSNCASVTFA